MHNKHAQPFAGFLLVFRTGSQGPGSGRLPGLAVSTPALAARQLLRSLVPRPLRGELDNSVTKELGHVIPAVSLVSRKGTQGPRTVECWGGRDTNQ